MAIEPDSDPVATESSRAGEPPIPAVIKAIWTLFAIWAAYYIVVYLVPEFRAWRAGS